MYADRAKVKRNIIKFCVDDNIEKLVESMVNVSGGQKQVIARDIFLAGLKARGVRLENERISA